MLSVTVAVMVTSASPTLSTSKRVMASAVFASN